MKYRCGRSLDSDSTVVSYVLRENRGRLVLIETFQGHGLNNRHEELREKVRESPRWNESD